MASDFQSAAEHMRQELGPALCLAKWKQVSLHLGTGYTNSCYHPPLHAIPTEPLLTNPSALHNTEHKKQQRKIMLKQERPSECSYCWAMEDNGKMSDRHYRSGEPWAARDLDAIRTATGDEDAVPTYVEINFNNACNLACSYCSPQFSSTWQQEVERLGGYPTSTVHNAPEHFSGHRRNIPNREYNPYLDAFWRWWPTLYPELVHLRLTGGEPLMDHNTYRVLEHIIDNPSRQLHFNVTSNFSVTDGLFDKYLTHIGKICDGRIEHFMQYVSVDAWGPRAEYIRHGLDFDLMWQRVDRYLTDIPNYNSLTFIITMNNLSVSSLKQLLEGILELRKRHSREYQRVWFDTPVLRQPVWQSLQILPESYAFVLEQIRDWMKQHQETQQDPHQGFKDYEIARLDRDIAWMKNPKGLTVEQLNTARGDFYRFFSEHDRRRSTDFLKTFPEMSAWWRECEYHAKKS